MHHAEIRFLPIKFDLQYLLVNGIAALFHDMRDCTSRSRRQKDLVIIEETVLVNAAKDVAPRDMVANLQFSRYKVPFDLSVQRRDGDTARNVDRVGNGGDGLQWALNTVVDGLH